MVRRPRPVHAASALAAGAAVFVLAACGGPTNPQAKVRPSIDGISASVGDVQIRNATVQLGDAGDATLSMVLFNQGEAPDSLSAVSPGAAGAFDSAQFPTSGDVTIAGLTANGIPQSEAFSNNGATPKSVTLPTAGGVFLNRAPALIELSGVATSARTGSALPVTLSFAAAGSITLQIPIVAAAPTSEGPQLSTSPSSGGEGSASASNSP